MDNSFHPSNSYLCEDFEGPSNNLQTNYPLNSHPSANDDDLSVQTLSECFENEKLLPSLRLNRLNSSNGSPSNNLAETNSPLVTSITHRNQLRSTIPSTTQPPSNNPPSVYSHTLAYPRIQSTVLTPTSAVSNGWRSYPPIIVSSSSSSNSLASSGNASFNPNVHGNSMFSSISVHDLQSNNTCLDGVQLAEYRGSPNIVCLTSTSIAQSPLVSTNPLKEVEEEDSKCRPRVTPSKLQTLSNMYLSLPSSWLNFTRSIKALFADNMKVLTMRYKELSTNVREKILFLLSSFLGTLLFLILFESFYFLTSTEVGGSDSAFMISYLLSYIISIAWQHALHRLLIFSSASYCMSLLNTYFAYSVSLSAVTMFGTILINLCDVKPRIVAMISMPLSAFLNFYLLTSCLDVDPPSGSTSTFHQTPFSPSQTGSMSSVGSSSPNFSFMPLYSIQLTSNGSTRRFYNLLNKSANPSAVPCGPVVLL